jgi:hypothetical protein
MRTKKPSASQKKVLLNIAGGFEPGFNLLRRSGGGVDGALRECVAHGWITEDRKQLTASGKEAAGIVLNEVPLPPHLRDLLPAR